MILHNESENPDNREGLAKAPFLRQAATYKLTGILPVDGCEKSVWSGVVTYHGIYTECGHLAQNEVDSIGY